MKYFNYNKGKQGEAIAIEFLKKQSYVVLEKNFRMPGGEIDIIVSDRDWLVFVEVKLKVGNRFGKPEEMIDERKINQIRKTAEFYLITHSDIKNQFCKYRIDAVCIVLSSDNSVNSIKHYQNISN